MPRIQQLGQSVLRGAEGVRKVRANPVARVTPPPIEWRKFCLNGYAPSAQFQNRLHEATDHALVHRTRQLFWAPSRPNSMSTVTSSSRARYRFAFRTSSYMGHLMAFVTLQPPFGSPGGAAGSYGRLKIFSDVSESAAVSTVDFHHGASPLGASADSARGWRYAKTIALPITGLSPDTDYYACFYDESYGCIQTATVIEMQSMTQHFDGYLPTSLNQDSEVLSRYRQDVATIQQNLWKHSGRHLINWTRDDGTSPITSSGTTATNIVDGSSTSVSTSTPGLTFDMRYKTRLMQTTVPCVMKAFGSVSAGGSNMGAVLLKDSSGSTVASISGVWAAGAVASWKSVSFNMPAALAKYDLQFHANHGGLGNTFSLYAVSIYEYET